MAESRRSLSAGLSVVPPGTDPETVRKFVTQEPKREEPPTVTAHPEPSEEEADIPFTPTRELADDSGVAKKPRRARKGLVPIGLVPVTVRLKPEIAGALKTASLQRQLAGDDVFTQQDLVEQALEPWLRQQGYLS